MIMGKLDMDWDEGDGFQNLQADANVAGIVLPVEIGSQVDAVLAGSYLPWQTESQILEHLARGFHGGRQGGHNARLSAGGHLSCVNAVIYRLFVRFNNQLGAKSL